MKLICRLFFIMIMLVVFQTSRVFAQVAAANVVAHGVLALVGGGSREKNWKKLLINPQHRKG
jgi:hypothetical protein